MQNRELDALREAIATLQAQRTAVGDTLVDSVQASGSGLAFCPLPSRDHLRRALLPVQRQLLDQHNPPDRNTDVAAVLEVPQ